MPRILDVEAALLLLELEPPFDQRAVQLARRRMAKRWHPDIAPPGRRHEHQRHLQAINEAADELERLAETSRGGRSAATRSRRPAAATRRAREDAGRRAYENEQREREHAADRAKHDPFGSRVPDHSVVHRYARCVSYPEWGVGTVSGIYFSGDEETSQQWARVMFSVGVRTVPAGSLQFVDFSKPDPAADRVERFMTAAQHALAEGDAELAAQRLVYARDAEPENPVGAAAADRRVLAGGQPPGRRADGARLGARGHRPPHPRALRQPDLRGHGRRRPRCRCCACAPPTGRRRRLGVGAAGPAAAATQRPGGRDQRAGARSARRPVGRRACSTWRSRTIWPGTSAPRCRRPMPPPRSTPTRREPGRPTPMRWRAPIVWPSAVTACRQALTLGKDAEVSQLLAQVKRRHRAGWRAQRGRRSRRRLSRAYGIAGCARTRRACTTMAELYRTAAWTPTRTDTAGTDGALPRDSTRPVRTRAGRTSGCWSSHARFAADPDPELAAPRRWMRFTAPERAR